MTIRVVGLDLSLTSTGMAYMRDGLVIGVDNYQTAGRKGATLQSRKTRLLGIQEYVSTYTNAINPDLVVLEAPSYGSKFGSIHDRSGTWWLVVAKINAPIALISPNGRAKYATGNGRGCKEEVMAAVMKDHGLLPSVVRNDDIADAVVCAAAGSRYLGCPGPLEEATEARYEALAGVQWPDVRRA